MIARPYPSGLWEEFARAVRGETSDEAGLSRDLSALILRMGGGDPAAARALLADEAFRAQVTLAAAMDDVFEIAAPDAPGLAFVAGMTRPSRHLAQPAADALLSVGGAGAGLAEAFRACIGEAAERAAQCRAWDGLAEAGRGAHGLSARAAAALADLFGGMLPGPQAGPAWLAGRDLTRGRAAAVPAALCLRPPDGDPAHAAVHPGTGCACGPTAEAAMLSGLLECVERDAAALWWMAGRPPRHIALETLEEAGLLTLVPRLRQGRRGRTSWLLDITGDLGIPCAAAVSFRREGGGFVHGSAARPTLAAAARAAFIEMCQMEVAGHLIAAKLAAVGETGLAPADLGHKARFEGIDAEALPFLRPLLAPAPPQPDGGAAGDLGALVRLLDRAGFDCLAVDLSFGPAPLRVFKMIVPGLQPLPSAAVTRRLSRALEAAPVRGGASVPLF